jgi:hypothetical protein
VNIERLLFYIFKYNVLIIEILFACSLLGVLLLAFRFFTSKDEGGSASPDWNRLEDNIKKILENASTGIVRPAAGGPIVPAEIPEGMSETVFIHELQTQLERAQIQLMQKDEEIKKLSDIAGATSSIAGIAAQAAPAAPAASADASTYEEKIKDLESRLNEYSIIEDDIADLSFYKEETVRLQSEVDKLTAELAALKEAEAAAPRVAAVTPPPPNPVKEVAVPVPETSSVETPPPAVADVPVAQAPATAEAVDLNFIDNDIMAEFERAVVEQKAATAAAKTAKAEAKAEKIAEKKAEVIEEVSDATEAALSPTIASAPTIEEPAPTTEEPTPAIELPNVDGALTVPNPGESESSESLTDSTLGAAVPEKEQEGDINIDKMLDEAHGLTAAAESEDVQNAIDSTLDTDKLLKEATGMGNIDSEALTEFSDFVKKEGA